MSTSSKNEEFVTSRKGSSISLTSNKSAISLSNPKSDVLYQKSILSKMNNLPLNTKNINFNNLNFLKNLKIPNSKNEINNNNNPTSSTLSTLSNPLKIQKQNNINSGDKTNCNIKKKLLNDFQLNQLINQINILFDKIQKLYFQNYPCPNECNLWIEIFKIIYYDIIEKNRENKFLDLIQKTLIVMFFSMIILYDINNQSKQKFFFEEMKNIINIHNLMGESIYGNSLNNPNINPKDESQILILSFKDMHNRILKILKQYNKINEKISIKFLQYFNNIQIESFDNIYSFYINEIKNPNHPQLNFHNFIINKNKNHKNTYSNNNNIQINTNFQIPENRRVENIVNSINHVKINNPFQTNTSNLHYNKNNYTTKPQSRQNKRIQILQNNIQTINGNNTFYDSSNNIFLFRKPIKASTPIKQRFQNLQKISPSIPLFNCSQNSPNENNFLNNYIANTPQIINSDKEIQKIYINDNFIIENNPKIIEKSHEEKKINQTKREFDSGKFVLTPDLGTYSRVKNNAIIYTFNNNNNYNHNTVDNYNNEYKNKNKTPIKGRNYIEKNIGHLNLSNYIKNQSLTPVKNINNNSTLIPFPPTKPYTLVLDLDETLVHVPKNGNSILLRPGLRDFLHSLLPYYELIIFTTGLKEYADQIIKFIEKDEKYFSYRLYRENAIFVNANYYKDLNKLGRDLKKTIIVDDKPINIKLQQENGIIIKPFIIGNENNNNDDYILFDLIRVLIRIAKEKPDDVRKSLKMYRDEIYNKISTD